ncbi:MAG TPA: PilX N-terminal domain-containing pilus assembly protein [Candidatus Polarisedimenticolia bacterium]|nr:PilX N-terminal domain-containing pilus assembly protein [Candidatus Polarisedimenticolia bacterium]
MAHDDTSRTQQAAPGPERGERGSALILATLVTVILSLLGISYMMMAQTENAIAENERNAAAALYVAEAGARLAVAWFNDPSSTGYLVPTTAQVDRTLRLVDDDGNPATARVLAVAGNAAKPLYKDATLTTSGLFDRPYRSAKADTFIGIETGTDPDPSFAADGPDLVVGSSFLTTVNNALFPNFPSPTLRARISRIEVYAPPIVSIGGSDTRMGIATVKVTAGVFLYPGTVKERQIATRIVKAVINELPVPGPGGPLQSCSTLNYQGAFQIHWGPASSQGDASLPGTSLNNLNNKVNTGLPYATNDPYDFYNDGTNNLATWAANANINGHAIEDPWFKYISGGALNIASLGTSPGSPQPFPVAYPDTVDTSHSNLFQNIVTTCPTFDYNLWKSIAQTGNKNNWYYKWSSADQFTLDGTGTPMTFAAASSGKNGVIFFDTTDGLPPRGLYTDPNGTGPGTTNLTPAISVSSGSGWNGMQGFVYMNTKQFGTTGAGSVGTSRTIFPPGEPGDTTGFVNLQYPASLNGTYTVRNGTVAAASFLDPVTGVRYCTDASSCTAAGMTASPTPVKDPIGLPFQDTVAVDGVMYISGTFTASGNANYFGSVVAQQGVIDGGGSPGFYFDESLIKGNWPRKGMNLQRVTVTAWQTDL